MEILYKSKAVEKQFSSKYKKTWKYPKEVKRKLEAAENFIVSSSSLLDIVNSRHFIFMAYMEIETESGVYIWDIQGIGLL